MNRKIYLAAPLFSEAEKNFNVQLKQTLSSHFNVYLPQEDGMLIVDLVKSGVSFSKASQMVFDADIRAINDSDILLIVLDGRTVDEGAAMELGYAFSKGKQCIGYSTDPRCLLPDGQNPMISCCLDTTVHNVQELFDYMLQTREVRLCASY
ncbi:MAG: nucleoside 2-deoxyribosyltransferase [Desulfosporosinus sp.]|nr:nucleoside 2-deoxyribosyltransferase [Desulfosporosinus sp.]